MDKPAAKILTFAVMLAQLAVLCFIALHLANMDTCRIRSECYITPFSRDQSR